MKLFVYLITLTLFTKAFAADPETERLKPALDAITPDGLLAHIKMLSSDEFEGRAPGSKGEELSIKYISDQFKQIGLSPGNPDGTYFQEVPTRWNQNDAECVLRRRRKDNDLKLSG